ncbi:hypothetical protein BVG16_23265 [Paenibacillus selenitireducens]|uniref:Uncharacterized protein n=1 Tax=Paenibacillus selenitireducens TaxID=1324314 RepID=A0A1T2X451_9BACL|nr:hypothetical protein [Paenibacillus selenitireducens]OPA74681.1 hypothetical protein BVG16_23265 [Paenibacillus selenitireducens]
MKKIFFSSILSIIMILSLSVGAFAQENAPSLTEDQIQAKFVQISQKYSVNDLLSQEDAKFVKEYAFKAPNGASTYTLPWGTGKHFKGSGLGTYSKVQTEGYTKVDIGVINNSVQVNMNTSDTNQTYHKKIKNSVGFQAFGLVGSDGVGIVADFTLSGESSNANYHKLVDEKNFLASVAYWYISPKGYVEDASGSQTIGVTYD